MNQIKKEPENENVSPVITSMITRAKRQFAKALRDGDLKAARNHVTLVGFPWLIVSEYRRLYDRAVELGNQDAAMEVAPFAGVVHTPRVF